jgi:hypothetical protein
MKNTGITETKEIMKSQMKDALIEIEISRIDRSILDKNIPVDVDIFTNDSSFEIVFKFLSFFSEAMASVIGWKPD